MFDKVERNGIEWNKVGKKANCIIWTKWKKRRLEKSGHKRTFLRKQDRSVTEVTGKKKQM